MQRVLVAGVGNIFLGDDAFGVEVARRLASEELPEGVRVADFGIRGIHLAYELLDGGYDLTILVDALSRGQPAGTLYVMEPDLTTFDGREAADAHTISPDAVLGFVQRLGGKPGRTLVVGCEPGSLEEGMDLSPEVATAVSEAVRLVREVIDRERAPAAEARPDRATTA